MIQLSPQVFLYDVGSDAPTPSGNAVLLAQIPSRAFGDGSHPTTRLCAGAVDFLCRRTHGIRVLDVGTGTGVLARIARVRGARLVRGTDIDSEALASACANSALDQSENEIIFTSDPPHRWGAYFDLVAANILEEPLRKLGPELFAALAPGGILLLSGFTPFQIPMLRTRFEELGLSYVSDSGLEGWALLMFKKSGH